MANKYTKTGRDRILEIMRAGPVTVAMLMARTGMSAGHLQSCMRSLTHYRHVTRRKVPGSRNERVYSLTTATRG